MSHGKSTPPAPPAAQPGTAAKVVPFVPKAADLAATIRKLAAEGKIGWGTHVVERMELRGITRLDVIRVLKFGDIKGPIEPGSGEAEWKCKMAYQPKGSREIGVATVVLNFERLFLKTAEWEDK